jgi:hypothetical protein
MQAGEYFALLQNVTQHCTALFDQSMQVWQQMQWWRHAREGVQSLTQRSAVLFGQCIQIRQQLQEWWQDAGV